LKNKLRGNVEQQDQHQAKQRWVKS